MWDRLRSDPAVAGLPLLMGEDAAGLLRRLDAALDDGLERLVVIGGDGTVNLVVNRLMIRQRRDVVLGLVPAGNGSDLARHLGLSRKPEGALHHALTASPRALDVLRLTTADGACHFAVNVLSAGASGIAGEIVNQGPRRSALTYLTAAFIALRRYQPVPCQLFLDDEDTPWFSGQLLLLAVANGRFFGKGMKIAPGARSDDGLAEVIAIEPIPWMLLPFKALRLFLGGVLGLRQVHHRQARRLRLEPSRPLPPFDLDGEVVASGVAEIALVPGALQVAGP